jgi:hypothetical protein
MGARGGTRHITSEGDFMRSIMQSRFHCFCGGIALTIVGGIMSAQAMAAPLPIVAKHSGKCLDVRGGPGAIQDGALIEQWECTGASNQSWTLLDAGSGQVELVAAHSGKCVEVDSDDAAAPNGTAIKQMDCTGSARQRWSKQSAGATGEFKFVHIRSGKCLDVTGGPAAKGNGPLLELWQCTGATNQTWTIGRNPLYWPFAQNSIWNTPIGSGADYVPAKLPAVPDDPTDNVEVKWSNMPHIDRERIILTPTAPMTTIEFSSAGWDGDRDRCIATPDENTNPQARGLPVTVPMPASYLLSDSHRNDGAVFLMPDRRTLIQTQPFARCVVGGPATSIARLRDNGVDADIFGDGRVGAHGGSRLSTLGGTIRLGEMRPGSRGPRHALKVLLFEEMELFNCATQDQCSRWPAFSADRNAFENYGSINDNQNSAMKMGALLAIPASVDITTIGLESEPGRQIAWTLQNYGAYVVDSTGGPGFTIAAEDGVHGKKDDEFLADYGLKLEVRSLDNTPWSRDLQRIRPLLHVVNNNSPTSIGGGGTPRQLLAPPFQ